MMEQLSGFGILILEFVNFFRRSIMWTKPVATDLRFGFEVAMYIAAK